MVEGGPLTAEAELTAHGTGLVLAPAIITNRSPLVAVEDLDAPLSVVGRAVIISSLTWFAKTYVALMSGALRGVRRRVRLRWRAQRRRRDVAEVACLALS